MEVSYSPTFIRLLKALSAELCDEALEKIDVFKKDPAHPSLKMHKLHGRLGNRYSFSVNYSYRIVFTYLATKPREACLLAIGDHDVYR